MRNLFLLYFLKTVCFSDAQNLVRNPSFSEVNHRIDSSKAHRLLPGNLSEVKDWYLPEYIHYEINKRGPISIYNYCLYYSYRDVKYIPKDKETHYNISTNSEQLFEQNLGFVELYINRSAPPSMIQQKLRSKIKKGKYCLKIKYKYLFYNSSYERPPSLDCVLSETDLNEYYKDEVIHLPEKLVKISIKDFSRNTDVNTPWQQRCFGVNLNGDEQFISIGTLKYQDKYPWGTFYVDDVELYEINETKICECEKIEKDLRNLYFRKFDLDTTIVNDTLTMYSPSNNIGDDMISPDTKIFLKNIISFMQRNPNYNIKFLEYDRFHLSNSPPARYQPFKYYLEFFGISKERISAQCAPCFDYSQTYCGPQAEYTRIGFRFYER